VITRIYYDKEQKLPRKIRDAEDNTTHLLHNENGELIATISPNGAKTEYEYNQQGELMSILNPLKGRTTLAYDTHGNLIKKTDANNNTTTYSYTREQQLKTQTNALNQSSIIALSDEHYGRIIKHWKREDAGMQRFLSRDPIGFSSRDFNFYRYVGNNVVNRRDPFGLKEKPYNYDFAMSSDNLAFFPYGDVPTVSHLEAIANKKKNTK